MKTILFVVSWMIIFIAVTGASCSGKVSQVEYDALESLYDATSGNNWTWSKVNSDPASKWSFPSSLSAPCSVPWQGITCVASGETAGAGCVIEQIFLDSFNMKGRLPSSIGNFSQLLIMNFRFNSLSGYLPSEISRLKNLTVLDIGNNRLSGVLPGFLGLLSNLGTLKANDNLFEGSIPPELGQLSSLTELYLESNSLEGSIPSELGQLSSLTLLSLNSNLLDGSIPSEFGQLASLMEVALYSNFLEGSLASELGQLSSLTELALYFNSLEGSIPSEFGQLSSLLVLNLNSNSLQGSIPSELGQLSSLTDLYFYSNSLEGTIPSELGQLSSLTTLALYSNSLVGSIPSELVGISSLTALDFFANSLEGRIPSELGQLSSLALLALDSNSLEGSIPSQLGHLSSLTELYLESNSLEGSIPTELGNLSSLVVLQLSSNSLEGTIPSEFGQLTDLNEIDLSRNYLSSSLPSVIVELKTLQDLVVSSNYLSSTFPASMDYLHNMRAMDFSSNILSGEIPASFAALHLLQSLELADNCFNGSLPVDLTKMRLLENLNVSHNFLTGMLDNSFGNQSSGLKVLDLSANSFSGPVPGRLFGLRHLTTVVLYSNCFSGSLPTSICDAKYLTTLIMDSLSSSNACDVRFPRWLVKVTVARKPIAGNIPACIWGMPLLHVLHLSGNGLEGSLGEISQSNSSLQDVRVSSNQLVGSIPSSWQLYGGFRFLDVSSNKISGTLLEGFVVGDNNSMINLTVNRLSGDVPSSFRSSRSVNILNGNLLQCNAMTKPIHDPDSGNYICGSSEFDTISMVWLIVLFGFVLISRKLDIGFVSYSSLPIPDDIKRLNIPIVDMPQLHLLMTSFLTAAMAMTVFVMLVVMTSYCAMKADQYSIWSTHAYQYLWTASSTYLHGMCPAVLVMASLYIGIAICMCALRNGRKCIETTAAGFYTFKDLQRVVALLGILVVHMVVTIAANAFYVTEAIKGLPVFSLTMLQISLSVFKLTWNNVFVGWALESMTLSQREQLQCSSFMLLFTFVVSPAFATFFSDPSCFSYVMTGESAIVATFQVPTFACDSETFTNNGKSVTVCSFVTGTSSTVTTSTTPSWFYSYQCSSAVLIDYIPVLLITYLISGVLVPCLQLVYLQLSAAWIDRNVPRIAVKCFMEGSLYSHRESSGSISDAVNDDSNESKLPSLIPIRSAVDDTKRKRSLFSSSKIISKCWLNVAVMLTFGLACPLLMVGVLVDSWSLLVVWSRAIQRYISLREDLFNAQDVEQVPGSDAGTGEKIKKPSSTQMVEAVYRLEECCKGTGEASSSLMLMAVVAAGVFWSLFVFDMVGDVYGPVIGGLTILVPAFGAVLWYALLRVALQTSAGEANKQFSGAGVELVSVNPILNPQDVSASW